MVKKVFQPLRIKDKSGKKALMIKFSEGKFTKKQIQEEVNNLSKKLQKENKNGQIMVSMYFGEKSPIKWASGGWSKFGEKVNLFNIITYDDDVEFEEPKHFSAFNIF